METSTEAKPSVRERAHAEAAEHRISRGEGSIAYADLGPRTSSALLLVHGIGDTRAQFDRIVPGLLERGFRVLLVDLRGCGASDATFSDYSLEAIVGDLRAIIEDAKLERVGIFGCSMGAAAAMVLARELPERVAGQVLLGPVTRATPGSEWMQYVAPLLFLSLWGALLWGLYYRFLFKKSPPPDVEQRVKNVRSMLREPGRLAALKTQSVASKERSAQAWGPMEAPTAILMGTLDPDFPDATKEANELASALKNATVELYEGVGHYPQLEEPERVLRAVDAWRVRAKL